MKERIQEIINKEQLTNANFAEKLGISPATISSILTGRNNASLEVVKKILQFYPNISWDWLVFGKGEMYKQEEKNNGIQASLFTEFTNPSISGNNSEVSKSGIPDLPLTPQDILKQEIRYIEKPAKKITEIRIFFDDNTYQIFKPET